MQAARADLSADTSDEKARALLRILPGLLALALLCLGLLLGAPARAQSDGGAAALSQQEISSWEAMADRAETAIEQDRASDNAFEGLRAELVDWRSRFEAARSANSAAISAVQAQIDALGPLPESGEEPQAVADQRAQLEERLAELRQPVRRAEIAYSRADALIRSIDANLRARQAEALLELGPSPLDPTKWPGALEDLSGFFFSTGHDIAENWASQTKRDVFLQNLPVIIFLVILALVLVARGRGWIELLAIRLLDQERSAARWLVSFIVSLGQILLPVLGLFLLTTAAITSGLLGERGEAFLGTLPAAGFLIFATRWLGDFVFPVSQRSGLMLSLSQAQRREGRVYANVLGLLLGLHALMRKAIVLEDWPAATVNVLIFPLLVVLGLFLLRISRFLIQQGRDTADEGDGVSGFRQQLVHLLGQVIAVLAVLGPALAAIGYFQAGTALVLQLFYSLELLALLLILQKMIVEIYVVISGDRQRASDALLPVILAFVLNLAALPVLALIWGARQTDISELWSRFRAGFTVGETHISPTDFLVFVLIFVLGYGLTRLLQGTMRTTVLPKTRLDIGGQNAVVSGLGYVGIFLAGLVAITTAGIDLSSLAIVAGALSVGVGFGLQTIVSNFVSGIILLIERPISEGDWIEVGGEMGFVRSISVRSTRIETFDRTDVIVPNADLISGKVTNWTRGNLIGRLIVPVGVAYGTDTRKVQKILQTIAEEQPLVLLNPPPGVVFTAFGGDSLNFEIRAILRDVTQILDVQTEILHRIAERFAEEGIEIPFAQRDIWLRNPEALLPRDGAPRGPVASEIPAQGETGQGGTGQGATPAPARGLLRRDDLHDEGGSDGDGDGSSGDAGDR
ncbi:MAG: mechanosensitive ion channel family protein [Rhodobacteraceae bacterium]|nr:mechanosensitive ion channel family protein [Paracoccaceae bacterium]MBR9821858.1 mechanosensitive ion channel family protein [Paracoccaceae bacterium]